MAKRLPEAALESTLYERVLPALEAPVPRCYGIAADPEQGGNWLLVEHVEGERYSPDSPYHRSLVVRWLADVHAASSRAELDHGLPDRGPAYYHDRLDDARRAIGAGLDSPEVDAHGRELLAAALERCYAVRGDWHLVEAAASAFPPVLVHGDLVDKNTAIRSSPEPELVVFDWETAGWGPAAPDVSEFAESGRWRELAPVLMNGAGGSNGGPERLRRFAVAGRVLRLVAALEWASRSLAFPWPQRSVRRIGRYDAQLEAAMCSLEADG